MSPKILKARKEYVASLRDDLLPYLAEEYNYEATQEAREELTQWVSDHMVKPQLP